MSDKILVGISGGVRSLVTLWLLKKQGHQVRGVFFDFYETEVHLEAIRKMEKKVALPIQIVPSRDALQKVLSEEISRGEKVQWRVDADNAFNRRFLWPRLTELRQKFQFSKIATGHRVRLEFDSIHQCVRTRRPDRESLGDSSALLGLSQTELRSIELPLGGIPEAMMTKIAEELGWMKEAELFSHSAHQFMMEMQSQAIPEFARQGALVSQSSELKKIDDFTQYRYGDQVWIAQERNPQEQELYYVQAVQAAAHHVLVLPMKQREIQSLSLEDMTWFPFDDLYLEVKKITVIWANQIKGFTGKVIQYEGQTGEVIFEDPIIGEEASLFAGSTVLFSVDDEILGGAIVTGVNPG